MRNLRKFMASLFAVLTIGCTGSGTVTTAPALDENPVKKVAIVVVSCHGEMNCAEIEDRTAEHLRTMRPKLWIAKPADVRAAVLSAGKPSYEVDLRQTVANATESDAILEIHIPYGKEGIYGWRNTKIKLTAALVRPDGTLLASGEATRRSSTVASPEGTAAMAMKKKILPEIF